jgi:PPOX class probable FMN-dependent enzyme
MSDPNRPLRSDPAYQINNAEDLRAVIPEPPALLQQKVFGELVEEAQQFIAAAPLLMLCTSDAQGRMDVSPKGDAPGFVEVTDAYTLTIPDRPGNRLAFGFNNLLQSNALSLIFLHPGTRETLRVNGQGYITKDPAVLARLGVSGKPAILATEVQVEECFFHCGKALIRSKTWQPDSWGDPIKISFGQQLAKRMGGQQDLADQIDASVNEDYKNNLY